MLLTDASLAAHEAAVLRDEVAVDAVQRDDFLPRPVVRAVLRPVQHAEPDVTVLSLEQPPTRRQEDNSYDDVMTLWQDDGVM